MGDIVLLTIALSLAIGGVVLWANSARFSNQIFFAVSLFFTAQLSFAYNAIKLGINGTGSPLPSLRVSAAISAFSPWILWVLKESFLARENEKKIVFIRSAPWFIASALIASLCFTGTYYYPADTSTIHNKFGPAYFLVAAGSCLTSCLLALKTWLQMRRLAGIRRLEMQFFVFHLGIGAITAFLFHFSGNILGIAVLKKIGFISIVFVYGLSAWAITFHRIFDIRHVLITLAQRIGIVAFIGFCTILLLQISDSVTQSKIAVFIGAAFAGAVAFWLDRRSRKKLDLDGEKLLAKTRQTVIEIALRESNFNILISRFENFLTSHYQTNFATLLFADTESYKSQRLFLRKERLCAEALHQIGWATPESLERIRANLAIDDLRKFLEVESLGVIVASPHGSHNPSLLLGLGRKKQSWPFTYPEVRRLQNIVELMDNILSRSKLAMQAAEQARIEHLALMSRGLAHDLKNLITPVSSFLIHTDNHFPPGGPEAEVHSAARQSVRVMTDYVREALFFSERLTPNFQPVDLEKLFTSVRELTAQRAARQNVTIAFASTGHPPLVADAVLLQRTLGNLTANAIDASRAGQIITLSSSNNRPGSVRLQVTDQGCGIAPENLGRIFDPYFTTKEFGDDVRGFGLGLTICQKIVHLHGGTISVDSQLQRGTVFSIDLPQKPNSLN